MGSLLIVEDDDQVRGYLRLLFSGITPDIRLARDGREALRLVEQRRPRLIVTDWDMPVMGGAGLLTELSRRDCKVPVIVLSALPRDAIEAPVPPLAVITKTTELDRLVGLVARNLAD